MNSCLKRLHWLSPLFTCSYPSLCSGMLPEAVLPPSKEHSYAQWLERTYQPKESRGPQAGISDSWLSSAGTQQCAGLHSPMLHSNGMETIGTCYISCVRENDFSQNLCTYTFTNKKAIYLQMKKKVCFFSFNFLRFKRCILIWCFLLTDVRSDLETTKTEDMRQCALCQQYGDSAPSVSFAARAATT